MLFKGDEVSRQAARGLFWLIVAKDGAGPDESMDHGHVQRAHLLRRMRMIGRSLTSTWKMAEKAALETGKD